MIIDYIIENWVALLIGSLLTVLLTGIFTAIYKVIKDSIKSQNIQQKTREKLLSFNLHQIQKQIDSKEYLPGVYIEINEVKENLRYFCYPKLFCKKFLSYINKLDFSYINLTLKKIQKDKISIIRNKNGKIRCFFRCFKKVVKIKNNLEKNLQKIERIPNYDLSFFVKEKLINAIKKIKLLESRILILLDDAGQGKTNLVCDLSKEFLLKLKIPMALFFGNDFYNLGNKNIKSIISENILYDQNFADFNRFINNECKNNKSAFIIIIDALNESMDGNFVDALNEFIRDMLSNKFVRIILTSRTEYYNYNFNVIDRSYASYILKIKGINSKLEEHEKENLFRKYLSHYRIKYRLFSKRVYKRLSSNFLLLRIFCEVYQEQNIGSVLNVYMLDLFQEYYRKVRNNVKENIGKEVSVEKVVSEVVKQMVNTRTYKNIPIEQMIEKGEIERDVLLRLIDENIFFRRDITNKSGVLLDKEVISFTFDEIRDFLIADYLVNVWFAEAEDKVTQFINEEILPRKPLFEGVSKYLFFFSKREAGNKLLNTVLEPAIWYPDKYIYYLFETNDVDITDKDLNKVKELFSTDDYKSDYILKMLIYYRYDTNAYKKLNISVIFPILLELSEKQRHDRFEMYFSKSYSDSIYDQSNRIELDNYFEFVNELIEKQDFNTPSIEFLFFLITCRIDTDLQLKARNNLNLIYKKDQKVVLEILKKYSNCGNEYFRDKSKSLLAEYKR